MTPVHDLTAHAADGPQAPSGLPRHQSRWMMALARIPGPDVALACVMPVVSGGLLLVQAWSLAKVLDGVVVHATPIAQWWPTLILIAVLIIARALCLYVGERFGAKASEHIKLQLRTALFGQLAQRGPYWSRGKVSGELAAGLLEQVEALDGFFAKYLPAMITAAVLPIVFAVALMPADVVAGLLLLVTAPLIPLFMALVGWGAQAASRRHMRAMSRLSGFFADRLRGAATLKMFRREAVEAQAVANAAEGIRERTMAVLKIAFLSSAVLEFFAALGVAGMAVYFGLSFLGFIDLRSSPLTLQVALFCLIMAPEAYAPLRQFAAHYHDRATAQGAVSELARIFDGLPTMAAHRRIAPARAAEVSTPIAALDPAAPALRLTQVSVCAADTNAPLLTDVHFALPSGAHVALMGASGAGKSTLLDVLARLRPHAGRIELDGIDLDRWDERRLRERMVYIGQRTYLFEGTIADNIRLAAPDADDVAVRRAADLACVSQFADSLPDGLDTRLGARGLGLSGGQAQRVALARMYLKQPQIILLDEPTAHLDDVMQAAVMQGVMQFAVGRTLVIATHSHAVAAACDACLLVENAQVRSLTTERV